MLTPEDIRRRLDRRPFLPMCLVTKTGDRHELHDPDLVIVGKNVIVLGRETNRSRNPFDGATRLPVEVVAALEELEKPLDTDALIATKVQLGPQQLQGGPYLVALFFGSLGLTICHAAALGFLSSFRSGPGLLPGTFGDELASLVQRLLAEPAWTLGGGVMPPVGITLLNSLFWGTSACLLFAAVRRFARDAGDVPYSSGPGGSAIMRR